MDKNQPTKKKETIDFNYAKTDQGSLSTQKERSQTEEEISKDWGITHE